MNPKTSSKLAVVIVTLFVVLVATTSSRSTRITAEAEETLDLSSPFHNFIGVTRIDDRDSNLLQGDDRSSSTDQMGAKGCCDACPCTRSIPPQCQCTDIKPQCHAKCKMCRCTRSQPPQCRCMDVTSFCYPKCSSSSATITNEVVVNGARN
ncbi:hypothetical protein MKW94_021654 [Papaver nudicaule]|uniref:Bowman-Birk serine protease inhibitors family domain-containing protein n=1 Tax=Papaver nudicaule TaxID=74823 RepID=A0AA41VVU6_PAPNU|nr:hypothetical protein [Papaver nudicaule]MCL7048190.1 hypothetical protein [Papaver nudicaule]